MWISRYNYPQKIPQQKRVYQQQQNTIRWGTGIMAAQYLLIYKEASFQHMTKNLNTKTTTNKKTVHISTLTIITTSFNIYTYIMKTLWKINVWKNAFNTNLLY